MPVQSVLILQENPKERIQYSRLVENMGYSAEARPDVPPMEEIFSDIKPDMIIADFDMPDISPSVFLQNCKKRGSACEVLFVAENALVEDAVEVMKEGALDYLIKPVDDEQLALCLKKVFESGSKGDEREEETRFKNERLEIITRDKKMAALMALAKKVAASTASVFIQGESGTGKELFARYIHAESNRSKMPFVAVNCAALPESLLESELFGHEKGAFTGAISRKAGKFELADRGTVFLDEISEMQLHLQAKLLRVLQENKVDRVGGSHPVEIDVRIIATTNRDIREAMDKGEFREDLYYRLNTIPLRIPPLRERPADVNPLCRYFIEKYSKIDRKSVKGMTNDALSVLQSQRFPGNVRELENIVHRAVLLAENGTIEPRDLLMEAGDVSDSAGSEAGEASDLVTGSLKEMEQKMIYTTLDKTEGNRTHAAKILGISVRTLRNKLNEYRESKP